MLLYISDTQLSLLHIHNDKIKLIVTYSLMFCLSLISGTLCLLKGALFWWLLGNIQGQGHRLNIKVTLLCIFGDSRITDVPRSATFCFNVLLWRSKLITHWSNIRDYTFRRLNENSTHKITQNTKQRYGAFRKWTAKYRTKTFLQPTLDWLTNQIQNDYCW